MNPEQIELLKTAARTLLAHRDAGRHCDPNAVYWAEQLLAQNPHQKRQESFDDDCLNQAPFNRDERDSA